MHKVSQKIAVCRCEMWDVRLAKLVQLAKPAQQITPTHLDRRKYSMSVWMLA